MDILKNIDELLISWGTAPSLADMLDQFIAFVLVLIVAFLADVICRNILLKVVAHLIRKTKATWDDIVFDRKVLIHLSRMVAPVIIYVFIPVAFAETSSSTLGFIQRVCLIYILITFLSFINSFLKAVYAVYSEKEQLRDRPLKGMLQTVQVILWFVGAIVVVSILIDKSPLSLLADWDLSGWDAGCSFTKNRQPTHASIQQNLNTSNKTITTKTRQPNNRQAPMNSTIRKSLSGLVSNTLKHGPYSLASS